MVKSTADLTLFLVLIIQVSFKFQRTESMGFAWTAHRGHGKYVIRSTYIQ